MACKTFRDIAAEEPLRKAALVGRDDAAESLAALVARMRARARDKELDSGTRMLLDALQDGDRYGFLRKS